MKAPLVTAPCSADWSSMPGTDTTRRCASCDRDVHDLSAMGAEEARALLRRPEPACVRFLTQPSGLLWFAATMWVAVGPAPALADPSASAMANTSAAPGPLRVRLVDASGAPRAGVQLSLRSLSGAEVGAWTTSTSGEIVAGPLPPGRYAWSVNGVEATRLASSGSPGDLVLTVGPEPPRGSTTMGEMRRPSPELMKKQLTTARDELQAGIDACPEAPADVLHDARQVVEMCDQMLASLDPDMVYDLVAFAQAMLSSLPAAETCSPAP